jgi:NarL family two-component system response regulator LiaR
VHREEETSMSVADTIRVMIVDDHSMVRRGLAAYLTSEPDIELVGEAGDGRAALELCAVLEPDVILMDLVMPELDGVEATRIICKKWPKVRVLALTSFQEADFVREALQAGAIGYQLKNISGSALAEAIRSAHAGRTTLAPEAARALLEPSAMEPLPDYDLTIREHEVLSLLVRGLSNAEISQELSVSQSTVKAHVSNILSKMGASSRAEAVSLAIRHGLTGRSLEP